MVKPSERIKDIYFKKRGYGADDPDLWIEAILDYLDQCAETNANTRTSNPKITDPKLKECCEHPHGLGEDYPHEQ